MASEVSVIIPAWNAEAYLAETIESALAQTRPPFEIIVVDDGSQDRTLAVAQRYAPRVRAIRKPNGGPASARNEAIRHASGEYLAFLDCDDLWVADKLEEQVAFLDAHPEIGLVYGQALMFRQEGATRVFGRRIGFTEDPSFRLLLYGDFIPNSTVVIRRACYDAVGPLNERRDLIAVEDYEYWMRIARRFPLAGISRPLAHYRLRDGNLMGDGSDIDKGVRLSIEALREIERLHPEIWNEFDVDRELLFARLHVRAGFAWKQRRAWAQVARQFREALRWRRHPRVLRWMAAAMILREWS
ncbi:MAG: glycosyltransferase [Blastocatellia bacterium]|nr:glycosyltransferase [Blastocatellia bacterium]